MIRKASLGKQEILVAPISGGCFGIQLAAMYALTSCGYKPDKVLAGSGGSVTSFITMAGAWDPNGILKCAKVLNDSVFIEKNNGILSHLGMSTIVGWFNGSFNQSNSHPETTMKKVFNSNTIQETEIWIGAINQRSGKLALFCNLSEERAQIKGDFYNLNMYNSEKLKYLSGDITKISRAMIASCSIPIQLNPQSLDDGLYIDCGTKFASPLTAMQEEIRKISRESDEGGVHIVYVSGYDVEVNMGISNTTRLSMGDLFDTIPNHVVRGMVLSDRSCAYHIVTENGNDIPMFAMAGISSLPQIINNRKKCRSSLIEIYPINSIEIDIYNFTGDDLVKTIKCMKNKLGIRLWWTGNPNAFNNIKNIICGSMKSRNSVR